MEKPLVSFSIENFITVGLIAAFWYVVIVGGFSVWNAYSKSAPAVSASS